MAKHYELIFIVNPVLSEADIKKSIAGYVSFLKKNKAEIVFEENWGIKQLAYPINKKHTGYYYLIEFKSESGDVIGKTETQFNRDENIMRFVFTKLDKYAAEYNEKRRQGLVGKKFDEPASSPSNRRSKHTKKTKEEVK